MQCLHPDVYVLARGMDANPPGRSLSHPHRCGSGRVRLPSSQFEYRVMAQGAAQLRSSPSTTPYSAYTNPNWGR